MRYKLGALIFALASGASFHMSYYHWKFALNRSQSLVIALGGGICLTVAIMIYTLGGAGGRKGD